MPVDGLIEKSPCAAAGHEILPQAMEMELTVIKRINQEDTSIAEMAIAQSPFKDLRTYV